MELMVELTGVNKKFNEKVIFEDFDLTVEKGEYVTVSGDSGKGKTTLLNIIGGLEKPDSGKVLVNGMDVYKTKNQMNLFRNTYGFIFQNYGLIESKTVEENLKIFEKRCLTGTSIEEALEFVGLKDKKKSKVYELSGGEQQRIAISRLLIKKCDLILADEPTGSLDENNTERVLELFDSLHKLGKTILVVSHSINVLSKGGRMVKL